MTRLVAERKACGVRRGWILPVAAVLAGVLAGCGGDGAKGAPGGKTPIVVYSPHGIEIEGAVKEAFEAAHPDIELQIVDKPGADIYRTVSAEREQPRCDVWWGGSPSDFRRAESEGLLAPYAPDWVKQLPAGAASPTGGWAAMWITPEVILYNDEKLKRDEVPETWDGLLDERWRGRIVIREVRASATMRTIFGALVWREWKRTGSEEDGFAFLRKLGANTARYAADPNVLFKDLQGPGPIALTLWNMPDVYLQREQHGRPFACVVPKQTPVPVEPIALVKGGPAGEAAKKFYDFVTSPEQLVMHAKRFYRIPARVDIPKEKLPEWMREMKLEPLDLDWEAFTGKQDAWIERWYREIKGAE